MKSYSLRILSAMLSVLLFFSLVGCENGTQTQTSSNTTSGSSDAKPLDTALQIHINESCVTATHMNTLPLGNEVIVYTRDFSPEGKPSLKLGFRHTGRTVILVSATIERNAVLYEVTAIKENASADIPIPYNGFAVSIPTPLFEEMRIRVGQQASVSGTDLLPEAERIDRGSIKPITEQGDLLIRRINYIDPVSSISTDGIYYLSAKYSKNAVVLPKNSVVVTLDGNAVASVETSTTSAIAKEQLVFVGKQNCAYANTFLVKEMKIRISDLQLVSSYSDSEAIVVGNDIYPIPSHKINASHLAENGIYLYNMEYETVSTPEADLDRVDVVIIDDIVTYIGERNSRIMLPLSGGVALSFVGEAVGVANTFSVGQKILSVHFDTESLPQNHVRINGVAFDIQKFDTVRAPEGVSLLYTPSFGSVTQTNQYGIEISIQNGKVIAVEKSKGNMAIPENGYVLSIHQDHPLYRQANRIKVGDEATVSLDAANYTVKTMDVSGINTTRHADTLIVYRGKTSTGSNEYGYEILVDKNGIMIGESYSGNAVIPSGGFVLSGHGIYKDALANAYCFGASVAFDESNMKVLLISTPETSLLDAAHRLKSLLQKLQNAKDTLRYLDYAFLDDACAELDTYISDAKKAFSSCDFDAVSDKLSFAETQWDSLQYALIEAHPVENRAIWYRSAEKSDAEVRTVVEKLKQLNINTLYLETWYNGRFIGYSDNDLIEHTVYNGGYDAMEGFVRICHEYGIEVHAWVQNFFIGTVEAQEQGNMKLANYYRDWLKDRKGKDTFFYTASNTNFMFLNPYDPNVRTFLIEFYREMLEKYDIDGLHLDYIRFPELNYGSDDFGYNENIVSAWQKQNNTTIDPATLTSGSLHQSWIAFRQEIINSFVKEVYEMVMDTKPETWLSAAVYPGIPNIKNEIFQDCDNWVKNGYMDELFSMSYGADNAYVSSNASKFVSLAGDSCFYSTGISAFGETVPMNLALQMTEVVQTGADGVAIFSLANIEPSTYLKPVTEGAFRNASVQTNKLNVTVAAQLTYILDKASKIYVPYAGITEEEYARIQSVLTPILESANAFDGSSSYKEQRAYCTETISSLENAYTQIETLFAEEHRNVVWQDFADLLKWLTKSANRIEARIN